MVGLSDPCGVGLSQYENVCGANRYSVGWCGSECHSVQLGGGAIVKALWNTVFTECNVVTQVLLYIMWCIHQLYCIRCGVHLIFTVYGMVYTPAALQYTV